MRHENEGERRFDFASSRLRVPGLLSHRSRTRRRVRSLPYEELRERPVTSLMENSLYDQPETLLLLRAALVDVTSCISLDGKCRYFDAI